MKKLLRFADIIILAAATLGMLMQLWILWGGTDDKGLYPAMHPGWIISWVLTFAALAFIWLVTRQVGNNQSYKANFPPSLSGALGFLAASIAVFWAGWQQLVDGILWLDTICGILGLLSGVGFLVAGYCRFFGKPAHFLCFMLPCFYFALHVFFLGREIGGEPEPVRYLFRFLATLSLIPASYQFWGFCVGSGIRSNCLFWCLLSGFLCIVSAPTGENGLIYLLLGILMLTNPCAMKYLPRRKAIVLPAEPESEAEPVLSQPEIPMTMEETFLPAQEDPSPISNTTAPADPELDVEDILADILRQIDSSVE